MKTTLIDALECDNEEAIVEGFTERYNVSYEEAMDIFVETKKWLWLASQTDSSHTSLFIDRPLLIIDEMWHNFILHTKYYYKFCIQHFKQLIHHEPTSPQMKREQHKAILSNPTAALKEHEAKLQKQYGIIYDHLGPETLLKWYETMAEKYTPEYIQSIKKY
ncbi:hypothetical protein GCM10009122_01990 [Fulvivirga kasyanovii]|uniref:Uncharacterized protein n=1 Tax=Fulvivirga kasyanovii TaxID=396812 RepID=A0ABW9RX12_9BACT|nr:hypothetical protein [Fulvivirga kasyanovii]MTI28212.1 hypothetical protein [Fulvivirga kasyanovii]